MSRYARIKTSFWKDPDLRQWPPNHRYLYLWLFSNEQCGISGVYALDLSVARFETGIHGRGFEGAWMGLLESGKVESDAATSTVWVCGKFKQETEPSRRDPTRDPSALTIKGAYNELQELKASPLVGRFWLRYGEIMKGLICPFEGACKGLSSHPIPIPSHPIPNPHAASPRGAAVCGFDLAYQEYPHFQRRTVKAKALKVWQKRGLEPLTPNVMAHIRASRDTLDWTKDNGRYVPGMQVWLAEQDFSQPPENAKAVAPFINRKLTPEEKAARARG